MAIFKAVVHSEYAQIPNATLQDKTLTYEARGLLAMLLSMPPHWEVNKTWVISQSPAGKDKVNSIFAELTEAGYIRKSETQRSHGRFTSDDYFIFPSPERVNRSGSADDGQTASRKEIVQENKHKEINISGSPKGEPCQDCNGMQHPEFHCQRCNGLGIEPTTNPMFADDDCNGTGVEPTCNDGLQVEQSGNSGELPDWSTAPEGATHWLPYSGELHEWYKLEDGKAYYFDAQFAANGVNGWFRFAENGERSRWIPRPDQPATGQPKPAPEVKAKAKGSAGADNRISDIFEFWRTVMAKSAATKLDAKRKKAIEARLKDGYEVEYIKQAIEKCSRTPHNMGQNDRGQKYNDITLICRDASNLERFAESMPTMKPQNAAQGTESANPVQPRTNTFKNASEVDSESLSSGKDAISNLKGLL